MARDPEKAREYARKWNTENADKRRAYAKKYRLENPEKFKQQAREQHQRNKEKNNARCREYHWANREAKIAARKAWGLANPDREKARKRHYNLRKAFGITLEQRDEMLAAQGMVCAICGADNPQSDRDWATDHCHNTGKVRGFLCHPCNRGLGMFRDNQDIMATAIAYLRGNE